MIDIINGSKEELFITLKERSTVDFKDYQPQVDEILQGIQDRGDEALLEYTKRFDGATFTSQQIAVSDEEFEAAYDEVTEAFVAALRLAIKNIREYHEKQKQNSWFTSSEGIFLGQKVTPIASVGIYVPGGTAAYPSSVLMNALPAIVAGVKRIVMVTPPGREGKLSPGVLVAAKELGIKEVYKVGGAQAVGALAFGTDTIPKVDKIVGPGNIYVATAKRAVYGYVDIDMIAGPSEILVVADDSANPRYVAADLLSQAEHDPLASSLLITTSETLAQEVKEEILRQTALLERKEIIEKSLKDYGKIILVKDLQEAVAFANEIAPEHLELCVEKPFEVLNIIENAGAIFLGHYTPEPLGDYLAGPNHVLPTSGTAKFYSPLSVEDYMKKSSVIYYSEEALRKVKDEIMTLAEAEGLTAHKNSIKVRYEKNDQ
ncbi:histidinol dehydrogenase [Clostridium formicaceticum]|uniref:Histidinol dehydrogenase n=1 Tax=Clostridium formicaceticum TaxID=1497 RepID=A0AAC9RKD3_9CLOT|nr:histidinol dehydrogenase [Clostridium formicaceticum]AOY75552.1 histidinol dehydrogenase [Clostridium formicaceticum]ARE85850.1 Histidinol dehydrogenase [Clostridium formicaceticum]